MDIPDVWMRSGARTPPAIFRKDDASAALQAAIVNVAGVDSLSVDGGLIQATPG
jgi:hypothetical protein